MKAQHGGSNIPMADTSIAMNVALSEGVRRLPVYLLLDCSASMVGAPIEAVRRGVELFVREVRDDPFASQTVYVCVIVFNSDAHVATKGLVPIDQFQLPQLSASKRTSLGKALHVLQQSLDTEVKPAVKGKEKGDWKPLVFILTDGEPTDDWQIPRQEIFNRRERKVINVITVGCGPYINVENLRAIAIGPIMRMDASEVSFKTFFKWLSQSVTMISKAISQPGSGDQPLVIPSPSAQITQYIP